MKSKDNALNVNNWFRSVARNVFATYLKSLGAHEVKRKSPTVLRFDNGDWYAEIMVLSEDAPRYSPRVEVGPLPEIAVQEQDKQVDILHMLPAKSALRRYNLDWRYSTAAEMEEVMQRVRDKIFRPYVEHYLANQQQLRTLVGLRSGQINEEWDAQINAHNDNIHHQAAEEAFRKKDYLKYFQEMAKIPRERRSDLDQRRLRYAVSRSRKM